MWRFWIGVLIGFVAVQWPSAEAIRVPKPPTLTQATPSQLAQLNSWLESLWQLTNGRYTVEVTTTNPNTSRVGTQGDLVAYNNAGSWKLCLNTSATTAASPTGTVWRCDASALTAP